MSDTARRLYTPSELNRDARIHLEAGFGLVDVEGEISNLSRPASGHLYFSLKDDKAHIRCALFRNRAMLLNQRLDNGQQVRATARVSLYEPRGDYQLIVERVAAAGEGRLRQLYEALKAKLSAEGLFDDARKQPLPAFPRAIGIITSPSGAAIRDLLHVLARRFPLARIRLYPAAVQGTEAPAELCRALDHAVNDGFAQVLIIGRGGGSLEDLWAFNDEALVRQVAACPIPIISAVGHEVDFSLCDFAADQRAPTPSAAAELATPDQTAIIHRLKVLQRRLQREQQRRLDTAAQRTDYLSRRLQRLHPRRRLDDHAQQLQALQRRLQHSLRTHLAQQQRRYDYAAQRLQRCRPDTRLQLAASRLSDLLRRLRQSFQQRLNLQEQRFANALRGLHQVSPLAVLARGYGITLDRQQQHVISHYAQAVKATSIRIIGVDYELDAQVETVRQRESGQNGRLRPDQAH